MLDRLNYLFGRIQIEETRTQITFTGLPANGIANDIYNYWRTKKIAEYMFTYYSTYKLSFPKFFAVEMLYMLQELRDNSSTSTPKATINALINKLKSETWLRDMFADLPSITNLEGLKKFKLAPMKHQLDFVIEYGKNVPRMHLDGYVLAVDTGGGKTIGGLMLMECLDLDYVIVIPPKRAVYRVWQDTLVNEYKVPNDPWVAADKKPLDRKNLPRYSIWHYEAIEELLGYAADFARGKKRIGIIIDESHGFNEITSQRTQNLLAFCSAVSPKSVIWSSATPIKALGSEMIPMLTSFDPYMTPMVAERFKKIFGKNTNKGVDIVKNRMGLISYIVRIEKSKPQEYQVPVQIPNPNPFLLDTIRDDMLKFMRERLMYYKNNFKQFRATYDEGLALFEQTIHRDDKPAWDEYSKYKEYFDTIRRGYDPMSMSDLSQFCNQYEMKVIYPRLPAKLKPEWKNSRSVIKYVDLKVKGECLGTVVGKRRAEAIVALIPEAKLEELVLNATKKTIIFTSYVEAVKVAVEYLKKKGLDPIFVYGANSSQMNSIVKSFFDSPKPKNNPLVTTYQSLSTAMPLTCANVMVSLNMPFRDHDYQQAIGRIDRVNQDTQTEIYNLILDTGDQPNISSRSFDILQWSQEMVEGIMGKFEDNLVKLSTEARRLLPELGDVGIDMGVLIHSVGLEELVSDIEKNTSVGNEYARIPAYSALKW